MPGDPAGLLLTDQNEKGAILWVANKSVPAANLDGYFIYKHDTRLNDPPPADFGDNADIYTFGGRLSGLAQDHWKYSAEGAYQFGRKQEPDSTRVAESLLAPSLRPRHSAISDAFGVNSKLTYLFKDEWNNQLSFSYEFLSGDNPNTGTDEMFDVLWGRWPQLERNVQHLQLCPRNACGPDRQSSPLRPDLERDSRQEPGLQPRAITRCLPTRTCPHGRCVVHVNRSFSDNGSFRGHYLQAILKYKFNKYVSAHLWSEFLWEGNFYAKRQMMDFLRAEVMFTF